MQSCAQIANPTFNTLFIKANWCIKWCVCVWFFCSECSGSSPFVIEQKCLDGGGLLQLPTILPAQPFVPSAEGTVHEKKLEKFSDI